MRRASSAAGFASAISWSRRRLSWVTAARAHSSAPGEQAHPLEHDERRDGQRAEPGAGLGDAVGNRDVRRAPLGRPLGELSLRGG